MVGRPWMRVRRARPLSSGSGADECGDDEAHEVGVIPARRDGQGECRLRAGERDGQCTGWDPALRVIRQADLRDPAAQGLHVEWPDLFVVIWLLPPGLSSNTVTVKSVAWKDVDDD
jgi:hypothetical protein